MTDAGEEAGNADRAGTAVEVGDVLPPRVLHLSRADLVRYAAAADDLNPIHYSDHAARAAGLPGVVAHGMLTMGLAVSLLTDWGGGVETLLSFRVRFTRPVLVPDDGIGAVLTLSGVVREVGEDGVRVDVTARARAAGVEEVSVFGQARAVVRPVRPVRPLPPVPPVEPVEPVEPPRAGPVDPGGPARPPVPAGPGEP